MKKLCGVKLTNDKDFSTYKCSIPLKGVTLKVSLAYEDTDANLPEMIKTGESVIKSWDKILERAVPPVRKKLARLGYKKSAKCNASDFVEPCLCVSDFDEAPGFELLLNLPELKGNYYLQVFYKSLNATPTEDDVDLESEF